MDLQQLNYLSIVLRILLSAVIGCMIGLERERGNRPAGFRTYTLVSVGACLVMMTNQYMFSLYQSGDPARLGLSIENLALSSVTFRILKQTLTIPTLSFSFSISILAFSIL